jgi:hypothetical protein
MTCFILAEGFANEMEAYERELDEIDARGLEANGTGTLLNERGGSVIDGSRLKRIRPVEPRKPNGEGKIKGPTHHCFIALRNEMQQNIDSQCSAATRGACLDRQPQDAAFARGRLSQLIPAGGPDDYHWRSARHGQS